MPASPLPAAPVASAALGEYRELLQAFRALRPDYEQALLQRLAAASLPPARFTVAELFYLDYAVKQQYQLPLDYAYYARLYAHFPPGQLQALINSRLC